MAFPFLILNLPLSDFNCSSLLFIMRQFGLLSYLKMRWTQILVPLSSVLNWSKFLVLEFLSCNNYFPIIVLVERTRSLINVVNLKCSLAVTLVLYLRAGVGGKRIWYRLLDSRHTHPLFSGADVYLGILLISSPFLVSKQHRILFHIPLARPTY